jgi:AraC-like DNA-binding protein
MIEREGLYVSDFSTTTFPPAEQFTAWSGGHAALFDFSSLDGAAPAAFLAEARTYLLGNLFVGWTTYPAHRFTRDERKIAEGIDQFLIRLNLAGGHVGTNGRCRVEARAGDIDVIDMTQPMAYDAAPSTVIVLGIPRPLLEAALPDVRELHGLALCGERALGALLADYLRSLQRRLPDMTRDEADGVAAATVAIVAGCLRPEHDAMATSADQRAGGALTRIKAYVEEHLGSAGLDPQSICTTFALSRSTLYRLFEPLGGVRRYIRDRRLVRTFVVLADPAQRHRTIGEIAFDGGFTSETHFGRMFRRAFRCTPGQARNLDAFANPDGIGGPVPAGYDPGYIEWLKRVSARDR